MTLISFWTKRLLTGLFQFILNFASNLFRTLTNCICQSIADNNNSSSDAEQGRTNQSGRQTEIQLDYNSNKEEASQPTGSQIIDKTPHKRKLRLNSLFRRLSLRNFMEYCVIALNEASSSGCSNKFDVSSHEHPVWLLGCEYELPNDAGILISDVRSKLWITYRRNFPPIDENARYTTDRGFGCMIRCGQMVLANALLLKNLGRSWRWLSNGLETNPDIYKKILKLFQDREDCPYSIHKIVLAGIHEGKNIGEWFGPNTIAQALKRIATQFAADSIDEELVISVDTALDNVVVIDEIKAKFRRQILEGADGRVTTDAPVDTPEQPKWVPGILFIQLRLGLTKINSLYFSALKKTLQFKNSLGIIGGRPNHALYLVGYTDDEIIYLDPHSTQQYVDLEATTNNEKLGDTCDDGNNVLNQSPDSTYHCLYPEKMPLERLDPSLALCFYFGSEIEFDEWCQVSQNMLVKSEQAPMFEITNSRPTNWNFPLTSKTVTCGGNQSDVVADSRNSNEKLTGDHHSDPDEEFEMLA